MATKVNKTIPVIGKRKKLPVTTMMHIYIRPKLFKYAFPSNLPVHSYKNADIMILLSRGAN